MGSVPPPPVGPNDMAETTSGGCPRGHCRFAAERPTGRSATRRLARVRRAATSRPRDRASRPHRTPRCATAPDHPARRNRMVRTDCSETRWRAARRSKLFGRGASAVRLPVPARRRRRHHHIVARVVSVVVRPFVSPAHRPSVVRHSRAVPEPLRHGEEIVAPLPVPPRIVADPRTETFAETRLETRTEPEPEP